MQIDTNKICARLELVFVWFEEMKASILGEGWLKLPISSSQLDNNIPNCNISPIEKFINLFSFCDVFKKKKKYFADNLWSWPFSRTIFYFDSTQNISSARFGSLITKQNRPTVWLFVQTWSYGFSETKQNADIDHPAKADLTDTQFIIDWEILHSIIAFS